MSSDNLYSPRKPRYAVVLFGPEGQGSFNESGLRGAHKARDAGHEVDVLWVAGQSAQQRRLTAAQEFVEYQHAAARFDDAGDFGETVRRLRDDGENQVQHGAVEAARSKRQALRVALHRNEIDRTDTRQGPAQHGVGQVEPDIVMTRWQMRQVQTGAHTGQQDASGFGGQGGQAVLPGRPRGPGQHRIVERRDQRVGMFEAQCRARGVASTNSGISASKCVPSSATIW